MSCAGCLYDGVCACPCNSGDDWLQKALVHFRRLCVNARNFLVWLKIYGEIFFRSRFYSSCADK